MVFFLHSIDKEERMDLRGATHDSDIQAAAGDL